MKSLRYSLILILVIVCSCATVSTENAQEAEAHYKLGVSYYSDNKVQQAFIEFQKALDLDSHNKDVLNMIGIIYLLKFEDYPKAIDFFQRALNVDRNFSEVNNNLGYAYEKMGRINDAIDSYKNALSNLQYGTPEKPYNSLGRVYYRLGSYDESINAYKDALKRAPEFYPSYYGLALCYNAKGKYGDASAAITRGIELDPSYKGDKAKAFSDFGQRKLKVKGDEEKDISDYMEILRY